MRQKFINIQKTYVSTKPSNLCSQKNNFKRRISTLEDGASGEQVGDIEKKIVGNLFKVELHYMKLINLKKIL